MPLLSRADHRPPVRCLAAARRAVSAQGRLNSSGHRTQNRAALTRWQCSKVSGALLAFLSDRSQSRTRVAVSVWTETWNALENCPRRLRIR